MEFIKTDLNTPHNVPEIVYRIFNEKYPGVLENIQKQTTETVYRLTKGIRMPDQVRTELIGALNAHYMSGYWHAVDQNLKAIGFPGPPDAIRRKEDPKG